ncbi:hypothetical protein HU830_08390 [Lactobacillus sp. DCY120]|uniref:Uncharacterized protein n=1 Tax=Bombilactobacillus apium TaxID=2675299 RepID=A0A850REK4_9LACO|nr:hypothetical protein [Bombilactobacillus apium]NVY97138.1 hypothetical protein [Bombilactobacillus apium]
MTSAILLITKIFRTLLTSLLVVLLVLLGGANLTPFVEFLSHWAHYLPTTFFFSFRTVNGSLGFQLQNSQVTYHWGLIVLTSASLILILLNLSWTPLQNFIQQKK